MSNQKEDIVFSRVTIGAYLFFLIWLLYLLVTAYNWSAYRDRLFPLLVGIPLLFFLVIKLVSLWQLEIIDKIVPSRPKGPEEEITSIDQDQDSGYSAEKRRKLEIRICAWIALLPVTLHYFGFILALPIYIFSFTYYLTKDLKKTVYFTLIFVIFIYILFIQLLNMIIWQGELFI